jgi:hypothetical protein
MMKQSKILDPQVENAVDEFLYNCGDLGNDLMLVKNAGTYQVSTSQSQVDPEICWTVTIRTKTGWIMTLLISKGCVEYAILRRTGQQLRV